VIDAALRSLGHEPERCRVGSVQGGDIHAAFRVEPTGGDPFFIKLNQRPLPRIFELEADGLRALREAVEADGGLLRVPAVLGYDETFLALEWIDAGGRGASPGKRLGEGLARLHHHTAPTWGWSEDNWIGSLPQDNTETPAEGGPGRFFAERRLRAQARLGAGRLGRSLLARLERFCDRVDDFLPLADERPALLHGDLWGGNWTSDHSGAPWLFDPAVHYGCREAELAFTRLFGGFPPSFYRAYEVEFPLAPGFADRVDLWNLYPLLVHANLFGGGYPRQVEEILRRVVG